MIGFKGFARGVIKTAPRFNYISMGVPKQVLAWNYQ